MPRAGPRKVQWYSLEFKLKAVKLSQLKSVDKGDLVVLGGDRNRAKMGIALYRRARDGAMFAFVGGKSGPPTGYIGQYRLADDEWLTTIAAPVLRVAQAHAFPARGVARRFGSK